MSTDARGCSPTVESTKHPKSTASSNLRHLPERHKKITALHTPLVKGIWSLTSEHRLSQIFAVMASQLGACFFIAMVLLGVSSAQAQAPAPTVGAPVPSVAPVSSPPSAVPTVAPVTAPITAPVVAPVSAPITAPVVAPVSPPPTATPTPTPSVEAPATPPPASTPIVPPPTAKTPTLAPTATVVEAPPPSPQQNAGVMTSPFAWKGLVVASALVAALAY
ncbi:hypothetical protein R1flu_004521 [Riccia fluitans]|uniref:Arabinogalactan-like protein n=1 Tax=Riccia fluitans TaxID=41844 RepID=A0ABD1YTK4_9MARC